MIRLHHFGSDSSAFFLNPDLIFTVEAKPDTIVHLTNGHEMYVAETPEQVVEAVLAWRRAIVAHQDNPQASPVGGAQPDA